MLEQSTWIIAHRSRGPQSTGSSSMHVTISKPSISLMKSNGRKFIGYLATHGATRGFVKEASIKIRLVKKKENVGPRHGIMAHFKHVIVAVQPLFIRSNGPRVSC